MYKPLRYPWDTPKILRKAMDDSIELLLQDVHDMLLLPKPKSGLHAGCNFSALIVLCSIISAAGRLFYPRRGGDKRRFEALLTDKFPWSEEPQIPSKPAVIASTLYSEFRCPLAHAAGLPIYLAKDETSVKDRAKKPNVLKSHSMTARDLKSLENSSKRPMQVPTFSDQGEIIEVSIQGLYWGVRTMITRLLADKSTRNSAVKLLCQVRPPSQTPEWNTHPPLQNAENWINPMGSSTTTAYSTPSLSSIYGVGSGSAKDIKK